MTDIMHILLMQISRFQDGDAMERDTSQTGLVSTPRRGSKPLPQPQVISSRTGQTFLEMTPY
jgi:hypothetical protein